MYFLYRAESRTYKRFLSVRQEGNRQVKRNIELSQIVEHLKLFFKQSSKNKEEIFV
jgi:hypothetical protein